MLLLLTLLPALLLGSLLFSGADDEDDGGEAPDPNAGDQTFNGADGPDFIRAGAGDDPVQGRGGADQIWGQDGDDILSGGGDGDNLSGNGGDDSLYGGDGDDSLDDDAGANLLDGGAGNDRIDASDRNDDIGDTVLGGDGADRIIVNLGDTVSGGAGADRLIAALDLGSDDVLVVTDFDPTRDVIGLNWSGELAATVTATETPDGVTLAFGTNGPLVVMDGVELDTLLANPDSMKLNIPGGGVLVPAGEEAMAA